MKNRTVISTLIALMLAAPFLAHAAVLHTKAGAWKDTLHVSASGMKDGPQSKTKVTQSCHKASSTVKTLLAKLNQHGCTAKLLHHTAHMFDLEQTCTIPEGKLRTHIRMHALSATHLTGTVTQTYPDGVKAHLKSDSRWVSATCKPAKQ